jgi:hypothetical protein
MKPEALLNRSFSLSWLQIKGGVMFIQQADLLREVGRDTMNEVSTIMVEQSFDRGAALGPNAVFQVRRRTQTTGAKSTGP